MASSLRDVPRRYIDKRPINRVSNLARFDTVVFIPASGRIEIWRYREGSYIGTKKIIYSESGFEWIKDKTQFLWVVKLMGWTADLFVPQMESNFPSGYWGLRFR